MTSEQRVAEMEATMRTIKNELIGACLRIEQVVPVSGGAVEQTRRTVIGDGTQRFRVLVREVVDHELVVYARSVEDVMDADPDVFADECARGHDVVEVYERTIMFAEPISDDD